VIHTYLQLAGLFASLSLLSIGGGNAVLPRCTCRSSGVITG